MLVISPSIPVDRIMLISLEHIHHRTSLVHPKRFTRLAVAWMDIICNFALGRKGNENTSTIVVERKNPKSNNLMKELYMTILFLTHPHFVLHSIKVNHILLISGRIRSN